MKSMIDRRTALRLFMLPLLTVRGFAVTETFEERVQAVERQTGGRLGVAVWDTTTSVKRGYRAAERFPMCSTFKVLAAAAVLARVDRGVERLDRRIAFGPGDLLEYA